MKKFIALLRGINVGGQKKIKMSDLKLLFEETGFQNVETYIQSGNVIFSTKEKSSENLEENISSTIKKKFDFDVPVIVVTPQEIESSLKRNPFIKKKGEIDKLYIIFLSKRPSKTDIEKLVEMDFSPEEFIIDGKLVYLFVPNGYGNAKLNNNFFENKLKVLGTTRNLKTLKALLELTELH
jgi:uncharacterized protein (DUF1697 family)